uniref:Ig-like domain-containing protein n=2 Tax=Nothobranchius kadleci TaxID=1051664 RepID=A0A1A8CJY0_NOTKA
MFVLIWVTLLCSVRGITANSEASVRRTWHCQSDYCVNFYENITAEAGLCVEISCLFTTSSYFKPTNLVWYKCESSKSRCGESDIILHTNNENKVQSGFRGRVSLLEPRLHHGNCSIIISDLQESDSGSYQLRVEGRGPGEKYTYTVAKTNLSLTGLKQKPALMVPPLTEGQQTTLTCTAPGLCPGSPPNITWSWRRGGEEDFTITGNITGFHTENLTDFTQRHSSTLTFNPSAEHHGTNITCKISFTGDTTTEETMTLNVTSIMKECGDHCGTVPWAVAAASLSVNVLCLVSMWLLWNKSKKVKPNQEDRTYMSLQKMDTSPEYDVIIQNKHG